MSSGVRLQAADAQLSSRAAGSAGLGQRPPLFEDPPATGHFDVTSPTAVTSRATGTERTVSRASPLLLPRPRVDGPCLSDAEAAAYFEDFLVPRLSAFFLQARSNHFGLATDGIQLSPETGEVEFKRHWTAASKIGPDLTTLALAVARHPVAARLYAVGGQSVEEGRTTAVRLLRQQIDALEAFDEQFPAYGGFPPWFFIHNLDTENARFEPCAGWADKTPGLDNGELAWAVYHCYHLLREAGEHALADDYERYFQKMAQNVVQVFYDPALRQMRAEACFDPSRQVPPQNNTYVTMRPDYVLDDNCEGRMLIAFAVLFGDWSAFPEGREAIAAQQTRIPYTYSMEGVEVTFAQGHVVAAHEGWARFYLPELDDPTAAAAFSNELVACTHHATRVLGEAGLRAPTAVPATEHGKPIYYSGAQGMTAPGATRRQPSTHWQLYTPYASAQVGLAHPALQVTFLKKVLDVNNMLGPDGMMESLKWKGEQRTANISTWDNNGLTVLGYLGGVSGDLRRYLQQDGLYDEYRLLIQTDFGQLAGLALETEQPLFVPVVDIPNRMPLRFSP